MSWAEQAVCANEYGLAFGSQTQSDQIATCMGCPVRSECLEDALADERLTHYYPSGIRGGLPANARRKIIRAERRALADAG